MLNPADIKGELARHYLAVWRKALPIFLNWTDDQVLTWAERYREYLQYPQKGFFNTTPLSSVSPLLIPRNLRSRIPTVSYHKLVRRIEMAVEQGDSFFDRNPDFDWIAARARVEAILSENGETLPVGVTPVPYVVTALDPKSNQGPIILEPASNEVQRVGSLVMIGPVKMSETRKEVTWLRCSSVWRNVLVEVLEWPHERTEQFIQNLRVELDSNPDDPLGFDFFFDPPSKFLFCPILGEGLHERPMNCDGVSPARVWQLLTRAIAGNRNEHEMQKESFDWLKARSRYQRCRQRVEKWLASRQKEL